MYKVLIVDDEKLVRIAMRNIVNWDSLGCEIIGCAKDGCEALGLLEKSEVDIVITDLKMPHVDGIELIQEVKKRNINCETLVLSNHGDYELVRRAMKEGAFDYLLKVTIEKEDIESIISQIKKKIESKETSKTYEKIDDDNNFKNALLSMIRGDELDFELKKSINSEKYSIFNEGYKIVYFKVDNIERVYKDKIKEHEKLRENIKHIIEENIFKDVDYKILFVRNHSGIIIFKNDININYIDMVNKITKNIKQYLNITISSSISDKYEGIDSIYGCFRKTFDLFQWRFYLGEGSVIDCAIMPKFKNIDYSNIPCAMEIVKCVKERVFDKNNILVDKIIAFIIKEEGEPKRSKEIFKFIFANIEGNELQNGFKNVEKFENIRKNIDGSKDVLMLKKYLNEEFSSIQEWINDASNRTYRKEIEDIISFVDKNIERKITLNMLSKKVNMNESYLSRIFKNETGKNITYFINERKMSKALELLSNKSIMIKEASLMVGIDDQFYFNKLFKKFYGINPSEFKKKCYK
ncbi:MAG: response regulator [Clostridium sp.]|uniref:response regulator n=1 Tax=Clostridium sp. TaxID=1506 RepID=UPI002FCC27D5